MGGWGWEEKKKQPCGTCSGSGQIRVTIVTEGPDKGKSEVKTCPTCQGTGQK
jgi:DnaJ-class molecular chaperone